MSPHFQTMKLSASDFSNVASKLQCGAEIHASQIEPVPLPLI